MKKVKKLLLPAILFFILFSVVASRVSAESSNCWDMYSAVEPICTEAMMKRNACTDPDLNSPCYQQSQILLDKCDQANKAVFACLGLDKNPWKLEVKNPGHLTCQEWKRLGIAGGAQNCIFPLTETQERVMWCLNSAAEVAYARNYPVAYSLDFNPAECYPVTQDDFLQFQASLPLPSGAAAAAPAQPPSPFAIFGINPYEAWLAIQSWLYFNSSALIEDTEMFALTMTGKTAAFEKIQKDRPAIKRQVLKDPEIQASVDELLNRTPELTEEIIKKAQADWDRLFNPAAPEISPYRLDILEGKIQIKLPGQSQWSDLKQGDLIPSGSTIFTGMDTTTVLSIKNKGVVQVLPFTEIVISETGLEQAADEKKTTTDIELIKGEIELNIDRGMFGPSFQVFTTNAVAGVRGTHFWVSQPQGAKTSTIGVYQGEVEVKDRNNNASTIVAPNEDKPGIVVVAQKLSVTKITILGFGLTAAVTGIIVLLKKRRQRK